MMDIQWPLKAHIRNGKIVLDEPIELPEGMLLEVEIVDESGEVGDEPDTK